MKLDCPHVNVYVECTSAIEHAYRATACSKEVWTCAWIKSMPPGSVLYDVGANVGPYTLMAAALGHTVVAIEPSFANYARLCENVLLNDLAPHVIPLCCAVGDVQGYTLMAQHNGPGYSGGELRLMTAMHRIDDLARYLPPPTHIKIDTDGHDAAVLAGCGDVGQSFMVEVTNGQEPAIERQTTALGLTLAQKWTSRADTPGLPPLNGWWYGLWERRPIA